MAGISEEAAKQVIKNPTLPFLGGDLPKNPYVAPTAEARTGKLSNVREIGPGLPELTGDNSQRMQNVRNNEAKYSPQLMEGLQGVITTRFEQIGRLKTQEIEHNGLKRKAYDVIREEALATRDPMFNVEETIFTMITDKDGKVDQQKVSDLLDDDRFKELSMRYLMMEKRKILEALGMRAIVNPAGQRGNLQTLGRTIHTRVGQGSINRVLNDLGNWLTADTTIAGRDTGLTNGRTVVGIGAATAAGAAIGTFTPLTPLGGAALFGGGAALLGSIYRSGREQGLRVEFCQSNEILLYAKNAVVGQGTPERDRLLYGVDPRDFVVTANGLAVNQTAVNDPNYGGRIHSTNLPGALQKAMQILSLQGLWAEAQNIAPEFVEDETQYIHRDPVNWRTASTPQTGERMLTDVHSAYMDVIRTQGALPTTYAERMNYFRQAEATVMEQRIKAILADRSAEGDSRRLDNLKTRLNSLDKDKPEYEARVQAQKKLQERVKKDKGIVDVEKDQIASYQTQIASLEEQRKQLEQRLSTLGGGFTDVRAALTKIQSIIKDSPPTPPTPTPSIAGILDPKFNTLISVRSIKAQEEDNESERTRAYRTASGITNKKDQELAYRKAEEKYQANKQEIDRQTALLLGIVTELTKAQDNISKAEKSAQSSETEKKAMATIGKLGTDYTAVTRYGIPLAALQTDTLANILTSINGMTPPPWPSAQNNLDQRRRQVLNAMIEARALNTLGPNPAVYTDSMTAGLTIEELLTLSPAQLLTEYTTRATSIAGMPTYTETDLSNAQKRAKEILRARLDAMNSLTAPMDTEIENLQLQIDATDAALEPIREQVRTAERVVRNWQNGTTLENALNILTEDAGRDRLANTALITATAIDYTEAERASGKSFGELELLQLMTGYRNPETTREEAFTQVEAIFDSVEIRDRLADALDLFVPPGTPGFPIAGGAPFATILSAISPLILNRTLSTDIMYRVVGDVANRIYRNAMTL